MGRHLDPELAIYLSSLRRERASSKEKQLWLKVRVREVKSMTKILKDHRSSHHSETRQEDLLFTGSLILQFQTLLNEARSNLARSTCSKR